MKQQFMYRRDPETKLYAVLDISGAVAYEASFNAMQAKRLVSVLNRNPDLTWEDCANYVEGRTNRRPGVSK